MLLLTEPYCIHLSIKFSYDTDNGPNLITVRLQNHLRHWCNNCFVTQDICHFGKQNPFLKHGLHAWQRGHTTSSCWWMKASSRESILSACETTTHLVRGQLWCPPWPCCVWALGRGDLSLDFNLLSGSFSLAWLRQKSTLCRAEASKTVLRLSESRLIGHPSFWWRKNTWVLRIGPTTHRCYFAASKMLAIEYIDYTYMGHLFLGQDSFWVS